ncbi:site-specific integrase [Pseudomonas sp. BGI-2]|uniref:site-specific integrase n=1 Tax=Pseudomonas sp. BGI-2 TaxID=2528211 RepID=UPI0010351C35|nr:site-specific integrase [Pseudomonas sp. BGI-2]TBN45903.1 site-specific integrase [Pseudomonas sp. BGI-2]
MAKFAKPATQAASVMKKLQGSHIRSVGTVRNYEDRLKQVTKYLQENRLGSLRDMTPTRALDYLRQRAGVVGQKTLDMERQALQVMMQQVTHQLPPGQTLEVIKSTAPTARKGKAGQPTLGRRLADQSRAYAREQMTLIATRQSPHNALATEIAHAAGLRAHELLGLRRTHHQAPDERPVHEMKFFGIRETTISYTVHGKGGLTREVRIPIPLARRLEATRLAEPRNVKDRNIDYQQFYGIGGGQPWSKSVSAASKAALGWSNGAHGLRHTYAQERMATLQRHLPRKQALEVVSQEMGHFRPEITEVYLR